MSDALHAASVPSREQGAAHSGSQSHLKAPETLVSGAVISGAVGSPPAGSRIEVSPAVARLAAYSWRFLAIAAAGALVLYLLVKLEVIIVPIIVALFLATLLVPAVQALEARGWRHSVAVLAVFLGALVTLVALITLLVPLVVSEWPTVRDQARDGLAEIQRWLASTPFGLTQEQVNGFIEQGQRQLRENSRGITAGVLSGARTVTEIVAGMILTLFLAFFLIKDSDRFTRWTLDFVGPRYEHDARELGRRSATAVNGYLRGQATVGLVDAVFIGIGLAIVGVPLVFPLAVITFLAAFLPLVGAFVAGALAALVALVTKGVTAALVVVAIALVVQQIEGHLLAPLVLGRAVALHPVVIILALGAGSILGGIVGAFLAVPIAGVVTAAGSYLRGREPIGEPADPQDPEPATSQRGG